MSNIVRITCNNRETHVGIPISDGPQTYRLLITWPFRDEGKIVELPIDIIESVTLAEGGPLAEMPKPLDPEVTADGT